MSKVGKKLTEIDEEPIQIFTDLGLTFVQAKLYLTLSKFGNKGGEVKAIFRESGIARQDIYRVLPSLQKLGLVEKIIAKPSAYRALEAEKGFSMLLNKKTEEYHELKKKARVVLDKISAFSSNSKPHDELHQFVITSERRLFLEKIKKDIEDAQSCIDIVYSRERMSTIVFHAREQIERALGRCVKIRALTTGTNGEIVDRNILELKKKSGFDLKLDDEIAVGLIVFDRKEVNVRISHTMVPSLWTNNRNVVKLAEIYFENVWNQATPDKKETN
jgi:sugar-specific transcriptional regulator TrmB